MVQRKIFKILKGGLVNSLHSLKRFLEKEGGALKTPRKTLPFPVIYLSSSEKNSVLQYRTNIVFCYNRMCQKRRQTKKNLLNSSSIINKEKLDFQLFALKFSRNYGAVLNAIIRGVNV